MARVELASKIIHSKYTTSLFRLGSPLGGVDRKVKGEQNLLNLSLKEFASIAQEKQ